MMKQTLASHSLSGYYSNSLIVLFYTPSVAHRAKNGCYVVDHSLLFKSKILSCPRNLRNVT